jgi:hypothetical protein
MIPGEAAMQQQACRDERVRLLTCEQLLDAFQAKAAAAAAAAAAAGGSPAHTFIEVQLLTSCAHTSQWASHRPYLKIAGIIL